MSTADVTNKVHALMYVSFVMLNIQEAPAGIFCDGAMRCRWKTTQIRGTSSRVGGGWA